MKFEIIDLPLESVLQGQWGDLDEEWETQDDLIWRKMEDITMPWLDDFEQGQRDPILVRRMTDGSFYVHNGHHRMVAAMMLGWDTIKALVLPADSQDNVWGHTSDYSRSTWTAESGPSLVDIVYSESMRRAHRLGGRYSE